MRLNCLLSLYAFILFWGTIIVFIPPSLLIYFIVYPFMKYPQDVFQFLSSVIFKIFFRFLFVADLELHLKEQLPDGAIYISTHQSSLDYPLLGSFIQKYLTLTNAHFENIPTAFFVGKLIGVRFLDRTNLANIAEIYTEFAKNLQENRNVLIFPEGTRNTSNKLKRFKNGAFRLSFETQKPIVPIIIDGTAKLLEKGDPCFKTLHRTKVKVTMLDPLYPSDFKTPQEMNKYIRLLMMEKLNG